MIPQGVLNLQNVIATEKYLTLDLVQRQDICSQIINQSFKRMNVAATQEVRVNTMKSILKKSLDYYERVEAYETCVLFNDIIQALDQQFTEKSNGTQNNVAV